MFIFENNGFTEREDMSEVYESIFSSQDDLSKALKDVGFEEVVRYHHKDDSACSMEIIVNRRISEDISVISKEYEFMVDWYVLDEWMGVLIKNKLDLQDFLAKYLPVVKLAGELLCE